MKKLWIYICEKFQELFPDDLGKRRLYALVSGFVLVGYALFLYCKLNAEMSLAVFINSIILVPLFVLFLGAFSFFFIRYAKLYSEEKDDQEVPEMMVNILGLTGSTFLLIVMWIIFAFFVITGSLKTFTIVEVILPGVAIYSMGRHISRSFSRFRTLHHV